VAATSRRRQPPEFRRPLQEPPIELREGEPYGGRAPIQRPTLAAAPAGAAAEAPGGEVPQVPRLAALSEMERTTLETLQRAKASLSRARAKTRAGVEARRS
jgi:hypothetical protein